RSPIADRRQLMDVGAAGPWAGFVVAILFLVVGLARSQPSSVPGESSFVVLVLGSPWPLGDSLVTLAARGWLFGSATVLMHPLAPDCPQPAFVGVGNGSLVRRDVHSGTVSYIGVGPQSRVSFGQPIRMTCHPCFGSGSVWVVAGPFRDEHGGAGAGRVTREGTRSQPIVPAGRRRSASSGTPIGHAS